MKRFDVKKYLVKEQHDRMLRGENLIPWNNPHVVRMVDYKRRKAQQALLEAAKKDTLPNPK